MKKHVKVYMEHFDYGEEDVIMCEYCNEEIAVDVHHIEPRGAGGSKLRDIIENLIGLCRKCHDRAENKVLPKITKEELQSIVRSRPCRK